MTAPSATAVETTTIELHIDIEKEDCWIRVTARATAPEITKAYNEARLAGLVPIPEEEEPIEITNEGGWTQWFRFSRGLMLQLGMVS